MVFFGDTCTARLTGVSFYETTVVVSSKACVTMTDCAFEMAEKGIGLVTCAFAKVHLQGCKFEGGLQVCGVLPRNFNELKLVYVSS